MNSLQKKLIGSIIIVLIILVLFVWLAVSPLVGKIKQLSKDYLTKKEVLAQMDQREFLFKDLEESYQSIEDELLIIEGAFLDQEEIVGFISDLEFIAKTTGNIFEITTVMSSPVDEEGNEEKFLSLNISLWGNFESLLLFLSNLEDSPYPPYRLLEIDRLSINRLEDEDGNLETNLRIKVYTK